MGLSDEQKPAIQSWHDRPENLNPPSTTPALEPQSPEASYLDPLGSAAHIKTLTEVKAKAQATQSDLSIKIDEMQRTLDGPNTEDGLLHWRAENELAQLTRSLDEINADIADIDKKIYDIRYSTPITQPSNRTKPIAPRPSAKTLYGNRPQSPRSLYLTILSALLGFNIFKSLFGRETSSGECGSWFRPVLEERGSPISYFWVSAERACPRLISGNLGRQSLVRSHSLQSLQLSISPMILNDASACPRLEVQHPD